MSPSISRYAAAALNPAPPSSGPDGTIRIFNPIAHKVNHISFLATMEFAFLLDEIGAEKIGRALPAILKSRVATDSEWKLLEHMSCKDSGAPIVRITLTLDKLVFR